MARTKRRGTSMIEFALISVVWVPMLLGTLGIGTAMIRGLQTVQIARDAGHMYARGVDFSSGASKALIARLGRELGLKTSGGDGVVILTTLTYVGRYQCKALGPADNSTPPNPTGACSNYGHFVFTHRLTIGDATVRKSAFGDPPPGNVNQATGYVSNEDAVRNPTLRAGGFTLVPAPKEDGTDGYQAGQSIYLAEAAFRAPDLPGVLTGGTTYSLGVF